ncbi:putative CCDC81 eukaryotic HU domain 1 [Monocercomonoides exilis]|uniref:putative CCDC81 eukaryotic HU domain 1 n=1 Tax=Monocercomonoides exilis TaxID=2049356 RepID=UPI00355A3C67|nr:putative CCDC81 eukaryotic HU domain 1 [Monocercomonoides exilis]|eukprot:MONOS_2983.1-p1 / transcript=MONOS_2983.1 / gene=MONOS_2983 / organism=Monocercomonoides_exilis_PA203 / gene_product=unspecified product / transcript_product=unspecified product / location=Mono_scaffold00066:33697-37522(-) / protein_length=1160 / sequence_SO=supercontig / SO=protein_coding / is_pseudo=false
MVITKVELAEYASKMKNAPAPDKILAIWNGCIYFLEESMKQGKGVIFPNFGTFTFQIEKLNVGTRGTLGGRKPVFFMDKSFSAAHGVQVRSLVQDTSNVATPQLNFTAVSSWSGIHRETSRFGYKLFLVALGNAIRAKQPINLDFRVASFILGSGSTLGRMDFKWSPKVAGQALVPSAETLPAAQTTLNERNPVDVMRRNFIRSYGGDPTATDSPPVLHRYPRPVTAQSKLAAATINMRPTWSTFEAAARGELGSHGKRGPTNPYDLPRPSAATKEEEKDMRWQDAQKRLWKATTGALTTREERDRIKEGENDETDAWGGRSGGWALSGKKMGTSTSSQQRRPASAMALASTRSAMSSNLTSSAPLEDNSSPVVRSFATPPSAYGMKPIEPTSTLFEPPSHTRYTSNVEENGSYDDMLESKRDPYPSSSQKNILSLQRKKLAESPSIRKQRERTLKRWGTRNATRPFTASSASLGRNRSMSIDNRGGTLAVHEPANTLRPVPKRELLAARAEMKERMRETGRDLGDTNTSGLEGKSRSYLDSNDDEEEAEQDEVYERELAKENELEFGGFMRPFEQPAPFDERSVTKRPSSAIEGWKKTRTFGKIGGGRGMGSTLSASTVGSSARQTGTRKQPMIYPPTDLTKRELSGNAWTSEEPATCEDIEDKPSLNTSTSLQQSNTFDPGKSLRTHLLASTSHHLHSFTSKEDLQPVPGMSPYICRVCKRYSAALPAPNFCSMCLTRAQQVRDADAAAARENADNEAFQAYLQEKDRIEREAAKMEGMEQRTRRFECDKKNKEMMDNKLTTRELNPEDSVISGHAPIGDVFNRRPDDETDEEKKAKMNAALRKQMNENRQEREALQEEERQYALLSKEREIAVARAIAEREKATKLAKQKEQHDILLKQMKEEKYSMPATVGYNEMGDPFTLHEDESLEEVLRRKANYESQLRRQINEKASAARAKEEEEKQFAEKSAAMEREVREKEAEDELQLRMLKQRQQAEAYAKQLSERKYDPGVVGYDAEGDPFTKGESAAEVAARKIANQRKLAEGYEKQMEKIAAQRQREKEESDLDAALTRDCDARELEAERLKEEEHKRYEASYGRLLREQIDKEADKKRKAAAEHENNGCMYLSPDIGEVPELVDCEQPYYRRRKITKKERLLYGF